jgi:hypothetical protein
VQEEILDKNPSAQVQVYAIWFNMLPFDSRAQWDGADLTDPRVVHLWDEQKIAGNWFASHVSESQGTEWDAYFLYDPQATWEHEPSPLVSWGGPVIGKHAQLQSDIAPLLGDRTTASAPPDQ